MTGRAIQWLGTESGEPMPDDVREFFERPPVVLECPACGRVVKSLGTSAHVCMIGHEPENMVER